MKVGVEGAGEGGGGGSLVRVEGAGEGGGGGCW